MSAEIINLSEYRKAKRLREQEEIKRELEEIDEIFAEMLGSFPPPPSDPVQHFIDDEIIMRETGRLTHFIRSLLESDHEDDH